MDKNDEELILDKIIDVAKISYDQELDRHRQLLNKSDNLIKYISAIFAIINIIFPMALKYNYVDKGGLLIIYFIINIPLILSLYWCIKVQKLKDVIFFPTGDAVIMQLKTRFTEFNTLNKMKNKIISYYSKSTDSLFSANENISDLLNRAHNSYLISLIIMIISIIILVG